MPNPQGTLQVSADTPNMEVASMVRAMPPRIQVHNAEFNMVAKDFGQLSGSFDPGLYLVRVELPDQLFEEVVRVAPGHTTKVRYTPQREPFSPSPSVVYGAAGLHEYTGDLTRQVSRTPAALHLGTGARLVIIATRENPKDAAPIRFPSVRLRDVRGKTCADLNKQPMVLGPGNDHLAVAFAAEVNPGGFVVEWKEREGQAWWRQPLWIPQGWVMLVFLSVPAGESAPDFASTCIHLARLDEGFEPFEGPASAAELALESLRTGRQLLSWDRLKTDLLQAKFTNPMLGIYGAYMVLDRGLEDAEKITLLDEVLGNLEHLIPGSPDVVALRVETEILRLTHGVPAEACAWPPMMRRGYSALRDADWSKPGQFLESGSVADRIRTSFAAGGIWSRWCAERNRTREFPTANTLEALGLVLSRLKQTAECSGIIPAKVKGQNLFARVAETLENNLLSAFVPALVGAAKYINIPEVQVTLGGIVPLLQKVVDGNPEAIEKTKWTGLNQIQIQDVAKLLLSSLPK